MSREIVYYAHQVVSGLVLLVKPNINKTTYTPLAESDDDDSDWVGYQHLYSSDQDVPSHVQIVFLSKVYPGLTLDNELLDGKSVLSIDNVVKEYLSSFQQHPDEAVGRYVEEFLSFYSKEEGIEARIIPWEEELYSLQEDNEFAGAEGLFFPIIHLYMPENDWTIVVRCSPVLGQLKE